MNLNPTTAPSGGLASSSTTPGRPTRVRYGVLGFCCLLSMITYLDRVCFGSAAPYLVEALGLTSVADLQLAFTAFAFAYAAFEVPSGWLGDVYGPRRTLLRIVLWWSVFTALTGLVWAIFVRGRAKSAALAANRARDRMRDFINAGPDAYAGWNYVSTVGYYISAVGMVVFLLVVLLQLAPTGVWPWLSRRSSSDTCPREM